jgi:hypothetical protein
MSVCFPLTEHVKIFWLVLNLPQGKETLTRQDGRSEIRALTSFA